MYPTAIYDMMNDAIQCFFRNVVKIVGITDDKETALEIFLANLHNRREAQEVRFFFPCGLGLDVLSTVGAVPKVGQRIYVHTLLRRGATAEHERRYDDFPDPWIVKSVDYSLTVPDDIKASLKQELWGHRSETYRAEVQLRPMTLRENKPRRIPRIRSRIR